MAEHKFPIDIDEGFTPEEEEALQDFLQLIEDAISLGVLVEADPENIYMSAPGLPDGVVLPLRKLDFAVSMMRNKELHDAVANDVADERARVNATR